MPGICGVLIRNLKKLLIGFRGEPRILVVFSNCRADCDRLILHLSRLTANTPAAHYPLHIYSLEKPTEAPAGAHVVIDSDARRLFFRAQQELSGAWIAISAAAWNRHPRGATLKLIPLTLPPFCAIIGNENGDYFHLELRSVIRHLINRFRQRRAEVRARLAAIALGYAGLISSNIQPLTYSLFRKLPTGKPLPIDFDVPRASDLSVCRIEQEENRWDRDRVAQLAAAAQSRLLLFCQPGHDEPVDDLLPLFRHPLTFAVTRQGGYREWRRITVPLSPFRPLAPGEASRVFAPRGKAVLVDRDKFLKLSPPATRVFGTAWLILFWRANAAGWRNYSVGSRSPIPQQEAYFFDEMLFVLHILLNAGLRRLACDAPQLCRGNVGFRPDLAQPYRALPRILVAAPYLPLPMSHGGAVRVYNLCKSLADRVDWIYICFRQTSEVVEYDQLHEVFRRVYVVDRDEIHSDPMLPAPVNQFESSSMRALIAAIAREESADLLQIEWTDMAGYRECAPHLPAILVEHDVTFSLYRQYAEQQSWPGAGQDYEQWLRFETGRLPGFEAVFVMSEDDKRAAIDGGARPRGTFVIPNGVDLDRFPALPPAPQSAPEIFFVGSFMHTPNLFAFEHLRTSIMPIVWKRIPCAVLRVVAGADHEMHWRNGLQLQPDAPLPQFDSRIMVHGFTHDLTLMYQAAHVVAVPVTIGAGTCIKVMEALACRRAVVVTPIGARGLQLENGFDAVICELGEAFADAICELLESPSRRDDIARNGRLTAETRFDWRISANRALDVYSRLIAESHQ